MKNVVLLLAVCALGFAIVGCGNDTPPPNAAGTEANTKKEYTKEDAMAAQPKRGKSSEGGE